MLAARLRSLGFFLGFLAISAFIFHPNHLRIENGSESKSHCDVCQTIPMSISLPAAQQAPIAFVAYDIFPLAENNLLHVVFTPSSPRGPPAA